MALLFLIICLIILSPVGFLWLSYIELNSCKDHSYEHLVRINKSIDALIDIAPSYISVLVGESLIDKVKNVEIKSIIDSLAKVQNCFKNSITRYRIAKNLFKKIEAVVVESKNKPAMISSPIVMRYTDFFERLRGDFNTNVEKYNTEIKKFKMYTKQMPTSYIAEQLKITCIMEPFD